MKVIPHRLHLWLGLRPCLSEVKTKTSLVRGSHKFRFDLARRLLRECELDGFKPSSSKGQRDVAAEGSGGRGFRVYGRYRRTRFTLQRFTLHDFIPTSVLSSSVRRPRQG